MAGRSAGGDAGPAAAGHCRRRSVAGVLERFAPGRSIDAEHHDRRARPQLAGTRRADDGARGDVAGRPSTRRHSPRPNGGRPGGDSPVPWRRRAPAAVVTRADPIDFPSWNRAAPVRAAAAREPADLDPADRAACSCRSTSEGWSTWRICTARSSSPRITRATSIRRRSSRRCRRAGGTAWPRRWRRSSSRRTSIPSRVHHRRTADQQLELLSGVALLQRLPAAAARNGHAADARATSETSSDEGYSVLIFPEGKRTEAGEINRFQPGVGDDRLAAGRAGGAGAARRTGSGPSPDVEDSQCAGPPGWPSERLCY